MSEKRAFDLRSYSSSTSPHEIAEDLASLVIEAGNVHHRVTFFDKPSPKLNWKTPENAETSLATLHVERLMKSTPDRSLIVSISPPSQKYGLPESRINVYFIVRDQQTGEVTQENYGIALPYSRSQCLKLAAHIYPHSDSGLLPDNELELRLTPLRVNISKYSNSYEVGEEVVPLPPEIWKFIASGEAKRLKDEAVEIAIPIAQALIGQSHSTTFDPILSGVWAESKMAASGFTLMSGGGSGCGLTNSELLYSRSTTAASSTRVEYCPTIFCPSCNWTPNSNQLQALEAKTLTCCPNCTYDPSTKEHRRLPNVVTETPKPAYPQTSVTSRPMFSVPDTAEIQKYSHQGFAKPDFLVSLLFPWLLET